MKQLRGIRIGSRSQACCGKARWPRIQRQQCPLRGRRTPSCPPSEARVLLTPSRSRTTFLSSVTSASALAPHHPTAVVATHQPEATTKTAVALPHLVAAIAKTARTTAAAPRHLVTTTTAVMGVTAPLPATPRVVLRSRNPTPHPAVAGTDTANRTLTLLHLPDVVVAATTTPMELRTGTIARPGGPRLLLGAMVGAAVGMRSARRGVTGDSPHFSFASFYPLSRIRPTCPKF